uniref:NADH-ubiquinone oxidoreductase chain 1 n=1 Tax=Daphnia galeata TaxID=27404 RepID=A0A1S7J0G8_9CRUS|nr:NADH dehydrogenase subunit 1 [Daphnia galeata]WBR65262.1 NADH dehydrogenase subunit 1 [Daphnia galeata]BAX01982.1 NADH dehydrogenase subunit 1 [Daphnia galeata]BAX01995.1 NADH dehydrogenase subunit 1 [Daphnia galeata]BAX02021.1 NADH dehydrogenase subunit 1 [Daphnia galeata]BAX02034.1 NADH dehydrogenase subunit 1 [Daphnia galeata]
MFQFVMFLVLVIFVLVGVAFFTLFERKLLGYIQLRKGPNKVGLGGILQPFSDAVKLFSKEHVPPSLSNYVPYLGAPSFSLGLSLLVWVCVPSSFNLISFNKSVVFFLCCVGMGVYGLLAAGWSSNSKYSLFGALRGVAQTISYEVSLVLVLLTPLILTLGYEWGSFFIFQEGEWFLILFPLSALIWLVSCLAETNRTPFDFAEGESELVSGYNTEYSSGGFALIMLAEYASILLMSFLFGVIFMGGGSTEYFIFIFLVVAFTFVWVRGTLPRFRYDKLMFLAWKCFLPFSLSYLILVGGLLGVVS